jgi:hypothetical protein
MLLLSINSHLLLLNPTEVQITLYQARYTLIKRYGTLQLKALLLLNLLKYLLWEQSSSKHKKREKNLSNRNLHSAKERDMKISTFLRLLYINGRKPANISVLE